MEISLKELQRIMVNDYLLEIEFLKSYEAVEDYAKILEYRFYHGICHYMQIVFDIDTYYQHPPAWIIKYSNPDNPFDVISWGDTAMETSGSLLEVIECLQIRVNNLLKELREA